jgi:hypothetical protein
MKIDQLAFYAADEIAIDQIKIDLNLRNAEWVKDIATGNSRVALNGEFKQGVNVAELQFNYDLGIEVEIIRYLSGPHWHENSLPQRKFLSHIGVHLDDGEPFPIMRHSRVVQDTQTTKHTSHYLTHPDSPGYMRTYHYRIYEMGPGLYIKYIKRITPNVSR